MAWEKDVDSKRVSYDLKTGRRSVIDDVNDTANRSSHYAQSKIDCIDNYIIDKKLSYCLGNAIKYIAQCELKNGNKDRVEDLKKAAWYIDRQIKLWEADDNV